MPPTESKRVFVTMEKIDNWFTYHPPIVSTDIKIDQVNRYNMLRQGGKNLAEIMFRLCPESPELSTAMSHLRTAIFWANAAIACNEEE